MRYLSVCSGIEAATCAWHPLGWEAFAYSEIEKFPSAVLAHHYPETPNLGDMTQYRSWPDADVDVLVGGTPCQSFSVAGLRKGLDDPRGNLMLTFGAIAAKYRPTWLVWENVPGVLSSNGGRDFGTFLGMLGQLGYGFAYRVLDAQFFGVAQRRRRVFVVGHLGDWRPAAAVLFERHSMSGHPAPRREAGKGSAAATAPSLTASGRGVERTGESRGQDPVVAVSAPEVSPPLKARDYKGPSSDGDGDGSPLIAHSLRGEGFDASEDGTGRGTPLVPVVAPCLTRNYGKQPDSSDTNAGPMLVPVAIQAGALRENPNSGPDGVGVQEGIAYTLESRAEVQAVAFAQNQRDEVRTLDVAGALAAEPGAKQQTYLHQSMRVRRLTPVECSRLQGFPDDYLELKYADADEAHAAQILHELWREAGAPAVEEQGWRTGISAALLSPEILLSGVYGGWLSWSLSARCAAARGALSGEDFNAEGFVRELRRNAEFGCSPYRRESFEQCAGELGRAVSELPYESAQARAALRDSRLWPEAQRAWPLRYALATPAEATKGRMNADGPRYKALGNSMAVPCMAWIGRRIAEVESINADLRDEGSCGRRPVRAPRADQAPSGRACGPDGRRAAG